MTPPLSRREMIRAGLKACATQSAYQLRTHGGRVPVQWMIDTSVSAMFSHEPMGTFDLTGPDGRFFAGSGPTPGSDPVVPALPLDLFVVGAHDPTAIMAEYARLTGHPEMPPLWSLGYQQSHRTLASRDEILQEAKTFREKKLPWASTPAGATAIASSICGWPQGRACVRRPRARSGCGSSAPGRRVTSRSPAPLFR